MDHAATTPVRAEVLEAMWPYFREKFGNPSSVHRVGQEARAAVETAREQVAEAIGARPFEIFFTGTTTTSDNLAIQGVLRALPKGRKAHLVTSAIEHKAVLQTCEAMEKQGHRLTVVGVAKDGVVKLDELERSLRPETVLVSVMYANNEVGTIQPLSKIAARLSGHQAVKGAKRYFHTDAAATVDFLDLDVNKLGVDLMTLGAHKFGGPKGIGLLFVRKGTPIEPITYGGHHERGFWPGTESVPLIVGMGKAMALAVKERGATVKRVAGLRDRLTRGILSKVEGAYLTGHPTERLADIASFVFPGAEGEAILLMLSEAGIAASSGSACTSGQLAPSHVLLAMGIPAEEAHGSVRFSLGRETTAAEIDYVIRAVPGIIGRLRKMAPKI